MAIEPTPATHDRAVEAALEPVSPDQADATDFRTEEAKRDAIEDRCDDSQDSLLGLLLDELLAHE